MNTPLLNMDKAPLVIQTESQPIISALYMEGQHYKELAQNLQAKVTEQEIRIDELRNKILGSVEGFDVMKYTTEIKCSYRKNLIAMFNELGKLGPMTPEIIASKMHELVDKYSL